MDFEVSFSIQMQMNCPIYVIQREFRSDRPAEADLLSISDDELLDLTSDVEGGDGTGFKVTVYRVAPSIQYHSLMTLSHITIYIKGGCLYWYLNGWC